MELKNIAIVGPGGNVGNAIISELLKDTTSKFNITGISRSTSTYKPPADSPITLKTADYTSLSSLTSAFQNQDAIVCCVTGGATQFEPQKLMIDAAIAAGVKLFFADEYVGNIDSAQYARMPENLVGAKRRIRKYLQEKAVEGKIGWTALNGGPFFDMWLMKGPAGFDIRNRRARIYGPGTNTLSWTPLSTIAQAAATMLRNPSPILNRAIHICGVKNLSQTAILTALEMVLETKFHVEHVDVEKINSNAVILLERGEGAKAMRGLTIGGQFSSDAAGEFGDLVENEIVGVEAVDVEIAVREALEKYGRDCPVVQGMFIVEAPEV